MLYVSKGTRTRSKKFEVEGVLEGVWCMYFKENSWKFDDIRINFTKYALIRNYV